MSPILAANLVYYLQLCGMMAGGGLGIAAALAWLQRCPARYPCQDCGAWTPCGARCAACAALRAEAVALDLLPVWAAAKRAARARELRAAAWRTAVHWALYQAHADRQARPQRDDRVA